MNEAAIQTKILNWFNAQPRTKAINIAGGPFQETGLPDILICTHGMFGFMEVKIPGKFPDEPQIVQMDHFRACGAHGCWGTSLKEAQEFFRANF